MTEPEVLQIVAEEKAKYPFNPYEVLMNSYYRVGLKAYAEVSSQTIHSLLDKTIFAKSRLCMLTDMKSDVTVGGILAHDIFSMYRLWIEFVDYFLEGYHNLPSVVTDAYPKDKLIEMKVYPNEQLGCFQKQFTQTATFKFTRGDYDPLDQFFIQIQRTILHDKFNAYVKTFDEALAVLRKYHSSTQLSPTNPTL